MFLVKFHHSRY